MFASSLRADETADFKDLASQDYNTRTSAENRLRDWSSQNSKIAKLRLLQELQSAQDAEAKIRIFTLLRNAVIEEKFGQGKGFLGIGMQNAEYRSASGEIVFGVQVNRVILRSAAATAGLKVGDYILALDGKDFSSIAPSAALDCSKILMSEIQRRPPGSHLSLKIGDLQTVKEVIVILKSAESSPPDTEQFQRFLQELSQKQEYFEEWLLEHGAW